MQSIHIIRSVGTAFHFSLNRRIGISRLYSTTVTSNPHFHPDIKPTSQDNSGHGSSNGNGPKNERYKFISKLLYGLSLVSFFKIAYDTTNAFWNYRKVNSSSQLQDIWNEAILDIFTISTKDQELQKYFGAPVRMGAPPLQSRSPLNPSKEGFSVGVVLGNWSFVRHFGETPTSLPPPVLSTGGVPLTNTIYNEDHSRAKAMQSPKKPELPSHIPVSIRESLAEKEEPTPKSKGTSTFPNLFIPAFVGFLEVELPLIGAKQKGVLSAILYTENSQWKVKCARILDHNSNIIKEVVPNQFIVGLDAN